VGWLLAISGVLLILIVGCYVLLALCLWRLVPALIALAERLPAAVAAPSGATAWVAQDDSAFFVSDVGPDDEPSEAERERATQDALATTPEAHHAAILRWADRDA
jgi:hypothetical protein